MLFLKKICPALLLCLLGFTTMSPAQEQGYKSIFGDSSTSWKNIQSPPWEFFIDSVYQTEEGDTVIDNHNYSILKVCRPNCLNSGILRGFVREDTVSGKVWFRDENAKRETLLMNMSLKKGDSFFVAEGYHQDSGWRIVDSVFHRANKKHIQIGLNDVDTLEFVEGVGPNHGFKLSFTKSILICSYKDEKLSYFDSTANASFLNDTTFKNCPKRGHLTDLLRKKTGKTNNINIYPNPTRDKIHFTIDNPKPLAKPITLKIFNAKGGEVLSKQIQKNKFRISNPGSNHVYFYQLFTNDYTPIGSGKIVFEN